MTIHPSTTIGSVGLIVSDLNRSLAYYQHNIGLSVHRRAADRAWLGAGGDDLLVLREQPGARPVQHGRTGLYHFALLLPNRRELANTLRHLVDTRTRISGMSDHGVSEAIYLNDPDGHGIEIYRDRDRAEWPMINSGVQMTVDPLDVRDLMSEVSSDDASWHGLHPATTIGHIHLHIATLESAEAFYCDQLGFDLMQRFAGQASFLAAGGYHHHLGLNTWAGYGAPPAPQDAARLDWFEIRLPDRAALDALVERLRAANIALEDGDGVWSLHDPARNPVRLIAR